MHELSLMEGVLDIIEQARRQHGFTQVRRVVLEIGSLAGVEREALAFCWEAVVQDTVAATAILELVDLPARAWCGGCAAEVEVSSRLDLCPACGAVPERVVQGTDLRVKALDVEGGPGDS